MMDGFVTVVMQISTIVFALGTVGISFWVGKVWQKDKGY
ncbi:hypothetical protein SAMN05192532_103278 [Alteribacillus iranensis]|uniref:Uncharacterized protein n=1 Tax=Alteribacillus iranensis TaxID=930128 RepID=A0A1I2CY28_9BACI|nr:hypothetical protein SAMN05192532_103278 [Alteribacillus iranensis]